MAPVVGPSLAQLVGKGLRTSSLSCCSEETISPISRSCWANWPPAFPCSPCCPPELPPESRLNSTRVDGGRDSASDSVPRSACFQGLQFSAVPISAGACTRGTFWAWAQGAHTGLPVQPHAVSCAGLRGGAARQGSPRDWGQSSRGLPRGGHGRGARGCSNKRPHCILNREAAGSGSVTTAVRWRSPGCV